MWQKKFLKNGAYVDELSIVNDCAFVGVGCVIKNSIVNAGAQLLPYSIVTESVIEASATVGPFAHLRAGSHICEGAKVGAFVEVKKSKIGVKSKLPHLSYVGDAHIGSNCNIGCGVIFCNYDGKNKYKTIIGNNCFIGANVNLVAPVEIGERAFIAAGTTITKNIAADEFAIGRSRQENKPMPKKLI